MLNDIGSKKEDECMQSFIEEINFLFVKLNLQTEISNQMQTDNSITIVRLQEENKFLKSEIQLKNEVIRVISNERKTMEERTNKTCETTVDNTNTVVTEKTHSRKINVTVVGDSIIKQVKPNHMRNNGNIKAHVKSFPGAKTSHMHHHAQPSLDYNPDVIVLHCGTNDLRDEKDPANIANGIIKLAESIKNANTPIIVSSLTTRSDKFKKKAAIVNTKLNELCENQSIHIIKHPNIEEKHLSRDGLHLNYKGVELLTKNISSAIFT